MHVGGTRRSPHLQNERNYDPTKKSSNLAKYPSLLTDNMIISMCPMCKSNTPEGAQMDSFPANTAAANNCMMRDVW